MEEFRYCPNCEGIMIPRRIDGKTVFQCDKCGFIQNIEPTLQELFREGFILYEDMEFSRALLKFQQVIDEDPTDEDSLFYLGLIHFELENYVKAFRSFKSVLRLDPDCIDSWYFIGMIYDRMGLFDDALESYEKSFEIYPEVYAEQWLRYIDRLIKNSEYSLAQDELFEITEFSNRFLLEWCYFDAKDRTLCIQEKLSERESFGGKKIEQNEPIVHTFENYLEEKGIDSFNYISHVENVLSILQNGILCRNLVKEKGIENSDISSHSVQNKRKKYMKKNYNLDIHDYVCLFFATHTPMLRNVCFLQYLDHKITIIKIKTCLMDESMGAFFTDKSCNREDFEMFSKLEELDNLNWEYLTRDYDVIRKGLNDDAQENEFKAIRGAEVLIPTSVKPEFIIPEIFVKSKEAQTELLKILRNSSFRNYSVIIDEMKFPLRNQSRAYNRKRRKFGI